MTSFSTARASSSTDPHRPWQPDASRVAKSLLTPAVLRKVLREYEFTHGYAPPDGTRLIPNDWLPERATLLGPLRWIEYVSRKKFEGPKYYIFHHDFRGANRVQIAKGRNRYGAPAWIFVGGGYTVTAHGIEDDASDNRIVPSEKTFRIETSLPPHLVGMGSMFGFEYTDKHGHLQQEHLDHQSLVLAYVRKPIPMLYIVPNG